MENWVRSKTYNGLGKDVTYVELEGEAHGFRYLDGLFRSYAAMAEFLNQMAPIL